MQKFGKSTNPPGGAGSAETAAGKPQSHHHSIIPQQARQVRPGIIRREGRIVGEVKPDGVFAKTVSRERHLLKLGPAWGWDIDALHEAQERGADTVRVRDRDTSTVYTAPLSVVWQKGFARDLGAGPQQFLRLAYFTIDGDERDALQAEVPSPSPTPVAMQGVLPL